MSDNATDVASTTFRLQRLPLATGLKPPTREHGIWTINCYSVIEHSDDRSQLLQKKAKFNTCKQANNIGQRCNNEVKILEDRRIIIFDYLRK